MSRKKLLPINCKLHCGVRAVRYLRSFLDCFRPAEADALRNPQRQHVPTVICNYRPLDRPQI